MTAPEPLRPLAVCIDDVGLHAGVNAAAVALYEAGRVSSWSVMVDGPALPALRHWLDTHPHDTLELGLHLNLTEALPGARWVRPLGRLVLLSFARVPGDRARLSAEIGRQLDAFVTAFGRAPDFIDGHQHVHQLPVVRELLLQALARRWPAGVSQPWLRACRHPAPPERAVPAEPWPERLKSRLIAALGSAGLARRARAAGLRQNARLLGVRRLLPGAACYQGRLQGWLARARPGDLLMVHPACALPGLDDPLLAARAAEFEVLAGPAFAAALQDHRLVVAPLRGRVA